MIYIGTPEDITDYYDEVWFVVRRLKPISSDCKVTIKHVPELSPSEDLLNWALAKKKKLAFNKEAFINEYKPRFIKEMSNPVSYQLIKYLANADKKILLVCYCKREDICHRSILKELIQNEEYLNSNCQSQH